MTLNAELTPAEATRLMVAARKEGAEPAELARKLVADHLPAADAPRDSTLALFAARESLAS